MIVSKKITDAVLLFIALIILIGGIVISFVAGIAQSTIFMTVIFSLSALIVIGCLVRYIMYPRIIMVIDEKNITIFPQTKKKRIIDISDVHGIYYYVNTSLFIKSRTGSLIFYDKDEMIRINLVPAPETIKAYIETIKSKKSIDK